MRFNPVLHAPWLWLGLLLFPLLLAARDASVEALLQEKSAPEGIVFEIVTGDDDGLEWALPRVRQAIERLRRRFPELPVAVVTHGQEMFALEKGVRDSYPGVHATVRSLLADGVTVHACGTYAGWRGLAGEDFPAYVDLSAAGPAQVNDYLALGYVRILVRDEQRGTR